MMHGWLNFGYIVGDVLQFHSIFNRSPENASVLAWSAFRSLRLFGVSGTSWCSLYRLIKSVDFFADNEASHIPLSYDTQLS